MSDKANDLIFAKNPDESAAAIDEPEVEGHRISVSPATENPDERALCATEEPEVKGFRLLDADEGPDDSRNLSRPL